MLNVLLVDDDALVRMFLRQIIRWEDSGCTVVADARDGEEALALVQEHRPDIILTDLSMPSMDGVALIRRLKALDFSGSILVLSCHEDFSHVKQALQEGADDYLLKNHLDAHSLQQTLETAKQKLRERRAATDAEAQLHAYAQKGLHTLQRELLERLLCTDPLPWEAQYEQTQAVRLPGKYYACSVVLARLACEQRGQSQKFLDLCVRLELGAHTAAIAFDESTCVLLIDQSDQHSASMQAERIASLCGTLEGYCAEYLNQRLVLGVSDVCMGDRSIARAVLQAREAVRAEFYGTGTYFYSSSPVFFCKTLPQAAEAFLQVFPTLLEDGDSPALDTALHSVFTAFSEDHTASETVKHWLQRCDTVAGIARSAADYARLDCLSRCRSCTQDYYLLLGCAQEAALPPNLSVGIACTVRYLREHFTESIGLGDAARAASLSIPYLSALFKREIGVGFNEYLTGLRLTRVKSQLAVSHATIKQIAQEAGFQDYQHFCKVFRKREGLSPAEYRKSRQLEPFLEP